MKLDGTKIRAVRLKDHDQWLKLWEGYNKFYGRSGDTALPKEIIEITWNRFFDNKEPVYALVAENKGQLLGLVHYIFHRSTITIEPSCYLQDLFTLEEARGLGIGRALIDEVARIANKAKSKRLYWLTHETNETAMKLYDQVAEKSGFIVYRKNILE